MEEKKNFYRICHSTQSKTYLESDNLGQITLKTAKYSLYATKSPTSSRIFSLLTVLDNPNVCVYSV